MGLCICTSRPLPTSLHTIINTRCYQLKRSNMSSTTQDIELGNNHADAAGSAGLAPPEEPVHWQRRYSPRITVVRLLSSIVPLGLCIAKAVSVAEGQSALPNTLDWIISVIWGLVWVDLIFSLTLYDNTALRVVHTGLMSLKWKKHTPNGQNVYSKKISPAQWNFGSCF